MRLKCKQGGRVNGPSGAVGDADLTKSELHVFLMIRLLSSYLMWIRWSDILKEKSAYNYLNCVYKIWISSHNNLLWPFIWTTFKYKHIQRLGLRGAKGKKKQRTMVFLYARLREPHACEYWNERRQMRKGEVGDHIYACAWVHNNKDDVKAKAEEGSNGKQQI